MIGKNIKEKLDSRINSTNYEKDSIQVIRSFENRGILIKGTTRNITSREEGFLIFFRPLVTPSLPLMKSLLTPQIKSAL